MGLLDNFFGSFNTPQAAMAAGLLSPTPNASFGEGLLQGQTSARQHHDGADLRKVRERGSDEQGACRLALHGLSLAA